MLHTVKLEFKKLFKLKSFWLILLFLIFLTSTVAVTHTSSLCDSINNIFQNSELDTNGNFVNDNIAFSFSLYNTWIGSITGDLFFTVIFYYILPLAACLPFSLSLLDEIKSGYLRQMAIKKGQVRYYLEIGRAHV